MRGRESRGKVVLVGEYNDSDFRHADRSETHQPRANVPLALEKGPGTWEEDRDGHPGAQPGGDRWRLKP